MFDDGVVTTVGDCADEESSPLDTRLPHESLAYHQSHSPLPVAPFDGSDTVIVHRENHSNVRLVQLLLLLLIKSIEK